MTLNRTTRYFPALALSGRCDLSRRVFASSERRVSRSAEGLQTALMQIEKVLGSRLLSKNGKGGPVGVVPVCVSAPRTAPQ
jgi:hypothetical protein